DIPRGSHVRVPTLHDGRLRTMAVAYDLRTDEAPYEDWSVHDEACFASFAERARSALHPAIEDPLLDQFWPRAREAASRTDRVGLRFVAGRHGLESAWGIANTELPLSLASETEAFLWF